MPINKIYRVSIQHRIKTKREDLGSVPFPQLWGNAREGVLQVCGQECERPVIAPWSLGRAGESIDFCQGAGSKCRLTAPMSERKMTWKLGNFNLRRDSTFIIFWKFTSYKLYLFALYHSVTFSAWEVANVCCRELKLRLCSGPHLTSIEQEMRGYSNSGKETAMWGAGKRGASMRQ